MVGLQDCGLHFWDIDWKIDFISGASFHAEFIGANEAASLSEWIIPRDCFDGIFPVAEFSELNEFVGVAIDGASIHARLCFTVEASFDFRIELELFEINVLCF